MLRHGESDVPGSSMPFFMGRDLDKGIPTAREDTLVSPPGPGQPVSGGTEADAVPAGRAGTGMACGPSDNTEFIRKGSCPMTREMNSVKNSQTTAGQKPQMVPTRVLREQLRQRAMEASRKLSRSVGRLTSCDALPCLEYQGEVAREYAVVDQLLYVQNCRSALERCIAGRDARLRYQWRDGRVTVTRFRKVRQGCVQAYGLQPPL